MKKNTIIRNPQAEKDLMERLNEERQTLGSDLYEEEIERAENWQQWYEEQRERIEWHNQ